MKQHVFAIELTHNTAGFNAMVCRQGEETERLNAHSRFYERVTPSSAGRITELLHGAAWLSCMSGVTWLSVSGYSPFKLST